ncbi:7-cyano-7-deazaguanine synthase [Pseudomonas indica]|uniref:7-cyano-7-deazaguanine synthase n=1 Tax=Pseudomonas indica TaxID=137658 RepID=A0A1G9FLU9_9PSED|nr:7-cyano-7-deazaguanine synthase [Pseudomonas indica]SDK89418.1 7-cyano-7-deazaguanine synthase [Pseudomonas indica]
MKKALVMLSGGADSATALFLTAKSFQTSAVFFDIGQLSADYELTSARQVCRTIGVPLEVVNVSGLKHWFLGLTPEPSLAISFAGGDRGANCPHGLFGLAATYCVSAGIDTFVTGMHGGDAPGPEATKAYLKTWGSAIREVQSVQFDFNFPLLEKTKAEVLQLASSLGVPLEVTRSCSQPTRLHCGACPACVERRNAFSLAGIPDPTAYAVS